MDAARTTTPRGASPGGDEQHQPFLSANLSSHHAADADSIYPDDSASNAPFRSPAESFLSGVCMNNVLGQERGGERGGEVGGGYVRRQKRVWEQTA